MKKRYALAVLVTLGLSVALAARPATALVVNIDASLHNHTSPVERFLEAGSYTAALLDGANDADPATLFTAWSFSFGSSGTWVTAYRIAFEDDSTLAGGSFTNANSPAEAFALTPSLVLEFDVPNDQTLRFRVPDDVILDNFGGVSLEILAVPEPSTAALLGGALLLLGGYAIRRIVTA